MRAIRHPDRFINSLQHQVNRVIRRPIRTTISIIIAYLIFLLLITFMTRPEEMGRLSDEGMTMSGLIELLPGLPILIGLFIVTVVIVPFSMVTNGVRRDMRFRRDR